MSGGEPISNYGYRYIIEAIAEDPIITDVENTTIINQPTGDINIYPNPASDNLVIDLDGFDSSSEYNIRLVSAGGAPVYESVIPSKRFELDVSGMIKGYYIIQVYDKNNVFLATRKLIIQ